MRCTKLTFNNSKDAKQMAKVQTERFGTYNRAYQCERCKQWHLTTEKLKERRSNLEIK